MRDAGRARQRGFEAIQAALLDGPQQHRTIRFATADGAAQGQGTQAAARELIEQLEVSSDGS
jgi:hypothetical protein